MQARDQQIAKLFLLFVTPTREYTAKAAARVSQYTISIGSANIPRMQMFIHLFSFWVLPQCVHYMAESAHTRSQYCVSVCQQHFHPRA